MLKKGLTLFISIAMVLSMLVPSVYAVEPTTVYLDSDRTYSEQDITFDPIEYKNPFGAVQVQEEAEEKNYGIQSISTSLVESEIVTGSAVTGTAILGITTSTNLLSMSEARKVEVVVTVGYAPDLENLEWTFGGLLFEEWKTFESSTGEYTGNPFIYFEVEPYIQDNTIRAIIQCDLPYKTTNLQGRPYPRRVFPELLGEYNLAVTDKFTNTTVKTALKLNAYDSYHTYDEILSDIDRIIEIAKEDRYLEYDPIGKSFEGRDIPFVILAREKDDLNTYLNDTLPKMLEDPVSFINSINDGMAGEYKPVIWFNNIHSDEANGVDAQIDMLEQLATQETISFDTFEDLDDVEGKDKLRNENEAEIRTATLDVQNLLDNYIVLFSLNNNPDGRHYNSRETVHGFDPNRDPGYQTQVEMAQVTERIAKWSPMIINDFHGFVSQFLIEPCTPPHDPNFEYDLLMEGMIDHAYAMGRAGISNTKYNSFIIPMYDYGSGWDDGAPMYAAVFGMMHGALGHTIEIPELNQVSNDAFMYAGFGSLHYALQNKEKLFLNQLEIYKRGIEGIDSHNVDEWLINSKREVIGRPRGDNENFFPEYFVIPIDNNLQKNSLAAYEMIQYLLRNGIKVEKVITPLEIDDVTYPSGTFVIPMRQAKRGLANSVLYDGSDFSDWDAMYAEVTMSFPDLRGFDKYEVRVKDAFKGKTQSINEVTIPTTDISCEEEQLVIRNTNNDAIRAVNELLANNRQVQLVYSTGENIKKGDFVVNKEDLREIKNKYYLVLLPYTEECTLKLLKQPNIAAIGNELIYVLEQQLGFKLIDSIDNAGVIVDASSSALSNELHEAILEGTSYIGVGGNPIYAIERAELIPGLKRGRTGYSHEGVLKAVIDTDSVITGNYNENDVLYNKSGSWIETVPETSTILASLSDSDDFYKAGWWPGHDAAKGKPYIIQDKVGDAKITLFANHIANRAHPSHQYRMLANAIYDSASGGKEHGLGIEFIDTSDSFKLGGDANVTVEITNNANNNLDSTLIVALYNKTNNMMINYSYINKSLNPGDVERITTGFKIPTTGEYKVKAFVWDNWENAIPLSDILEIDVLK